MNRFACLSAWAAILALSAGSAMGGTQTETIPAEQTDSFNWNANQTGAVVVCVDGDDDVDGLLSLRIYLANPDSDEEPVLLGEDLSADDNARVQFFARAGQTYDIQVVNSSETRVVYDLEIEHISESRENEQVDGSDSVSFPYIAQQRGPGNLVITVHGNADEDDDPEDDENKSPDLDIEVYDSRGRLVIQAISQDDHERVEFSTIPNEEYEIVIVNYSEAPNTFIVDLAD